MKVIGAGFGRTGTFSLRAAMNTIGFGPCYHMAEVGSHPEHGAVWSAAAEGNPPDWREFLADYQSTMDWPGCLFWKELSETFPDAKVVLNTRDPERWHDSVRNTFLKDYQPPEDGGDPLAGLPPHARKLYGMMQAVMGRQFGSMENLVDPERAQETFRQHYAEVQATIPADRLLVYEVKQGWEPLCEFLDVPVPDEEFPHLNDRANFDHISEYFLSLRE